MHIRIPKRLLSLHHDQITVEELSREEPSSISTGERGADLYHPVYHFGPVVVCHLMTFKGLRTCHIHLFSFKERTEYGLVLKLHLLYVSLVIRLLISDKGVTMNLCILIALLLLVVIHSASNDC